MNETTLSEDDPAAPLTELDRIDLVNSASARSPRMRAMLWAALSPDGMVLSAFGRRTIAHNASLKSEFAAIANGFITVCEDIGPRDDGHRLRIERRWNAALRPGMATLASWVGDDLVFLRFLNMPARRVGVARLCRLLADEGARTKLLDAPPARYADSVAREPAVDEWLSAVLSLLELVDRAPT